MCYLSHDGSSLRTWWKPITKFDCAGSSANSYSAIQCVRDLDAGPIYMNWPLSLLWNAEEIYIHANDFIEEMIVEILKEKPVPSPQVGEVVHFKRRKPEQGDWSTVESLEEVFDYIRMLDAEGYPPAFVKVGPFRLEFTRASRRTNHIHADVKIIDEREQ